MNVYLLASDYDVDLTADLPEGADHLVSDLELDYIFRAMARDDKRIDRVSRQVLLTPLTDREAILYRQAILHDMERHEDAWRSLYTLLDTALKHRRNARQSTLFLATRVGSAVAVLDRYLDLLKLLRDFADEQTGNVTASGLKRLLSMLQDQIDDTFLKHARSLLKELRFRNGILMGVTLGVNNRATDYTLLRQKEEQKGWFARRRENKESRYTLLPLDETGTIDINNRQNLALSESLVTLTTAAHHVESFIVRLTEELGFYIGALNLQQDLAARGVPLTFPELQMGQGKVRHLRDLRDVSLALAGTPTVGNDIDAEQINLHLITGANQGGKSTFLRSLGQAQLLAQAGLRVGAQSFVTHLVGALYTHFQKEEDRTMQSGKLDEELSRMGDIARRIAPGDLILFNESFQSTNELEGSAIAKEVALALADHAIEVVFVTHLYTFADDVRERERGDTAYWRAQRLDDGSRSFKIVPGAPQRTAHGMDLYCKIFGPEAL